MKLIKPKVEILDKLDGQAILERIEQVARTCYKSEPKYGYEFTTDNGLKVVVEDTERKGQGSTGKRVSVTADKLVKRLIESKHEAMLEFVDITVKFTTDRAIANEIVRHRLASYAQESTRYCNYSKDKFGNELTFIQPYSLDDDRLALYGPYHNVIRDKSPESIFIASLNNAEKDYIDLINLGWTPQQARAVLPLALKTEINMKANLREWRHFLKLRCSTAAHPDIRILALDLLKQFHEQIPIIFDDLHEQYFGEKE